MRKALLLAAAAVLAFTAGEAMAATLDAARRGRDLVVVDLPRHLDEAAVLALQSADRALLCREVLTELSYTE